MGRRGDLDFLSNRLRRVHGQCVLELVTCRVAAPHRRGRAGRYGSQDRANVAGRSDGRIGSSCGSLPCEVWLLRNLGGPSRTASSAPGPTPDASAGSTTDTGSCPTIAPCPTADTTATGPASDSAPGSSGPDYDGYDLHHRDPSARYVEPEPRRRVARYASVVGRATAGEGGLLGVRAGRNRSGWQAGSKGEDLFGFDSCRRDAPLCVYPPGYGRRREAEGHSDRPLQAAVQRGRDH